MTARVRLFIAWLMGLACVAAAPVLAAPAAVPSCDANRPEAPPPAPGFRFTADRVEQWLGATRAPPTVAKLSEATVRYIVDCGNFDPRLLYPTRIAQQLSASLEDWSALTDDVQRIGRRFGPRFLDPMQLHAKAGSLAAWSLAEPAAAEAVNALLRRRSAVLGLATAAAQGDRDAAARYAGLAVEMAADPFVREVFVGATMARSVDADLYAVTALEGTDDVIRWRAHALREMLGAGSAQRARAVFARLEPNTVGPAADEIESRPRGRGGDGSESRERRTRTVQDCSWDSGYEFEPGEAEAQPVQKFVCRDVEVED